MQRIVIAILAFVLVIGGGLMLYAWTPGAMPGDAGVSSGGVREDMLVAAALNARATGGPGEARTALPTGLRSGSEDGLAIYPGRRALARLAGRVVDARGCAVTSAKVTAVATSGRAPFGAAIGDERRTERTCAAGPDGSFGWSDLPEGPYLISATDTHGRQGGLEVAISALTPAPRARLVIRDLPSAERDFVVRVVDAEGQPVAGASVEVTGGVRRSGVFGQSGRPPLVGTSDEEGRAGFAGRQLLGAVVRARTLDGRIGMATVFRREGVVNAMREGGLVVKVAAPGKIRGSLTGVPLEQVEGARVIAYEVDTDAAYSLLTYSVRLEAIVKQGRYAFDGLPEGRHVLNLESDAGLRLVVPPWKAGEEPYPNSIEPIAVHVAAGGEITQDLACASGGTVTGTVRDATGAPLAGAEVVATFAPKDTTFIDTVTWQGLPVQHLNHEDPADFAVHPVTHPRCETHADGSYRLAGLQPGLHRVEVRKPRFVIERRMDVEVGDGTQRVLDFTLPLAGVLQGVGDPDSLVVLRRVEAAGPCLCARLPESGEFTLPGLAPGRYMVGIADADSSGPATELVETVIEVGKTTILDLLAHGADGLQGRVMGKGGPIQGANVGYGARRVATDDQGRFVLRLPARVEGELWMTLEFGACTWSLHLPARPVGSSEWPGDLRLGPHQADFRSESSDGTPVACTITVTGSVAAPPLLLEANLGETPIAIDTTGIGSLGELLPGRYHARAEFAGGGSVEVDFELPTLGPVWLREPPLGEVLVRVQDPRGLPLAAVTVELEELGDRNARLAHAQPVKRVRSLKDFDVEVAQSTFIADPAKDTTPVTIQLQLNDLFKTLGEQHSFRGVSGLPLLSASFGEIAGSHGRRATTGKDGLARFHALPLADYVVRLPIPETAANDPAQQAAWPSDETPVRVVAKTCSEVVRVLPRR